MNQREQIVQQALALPPEDRIFVADALEQSLTSGEFATPEIAAAWIAEIERRISAYDRGETPTTGLEETLDNLRRQLADHRTRKVNS